MGLGNPCGNPPGVTGPDSTARAGPTSPPYRVERDSTTTDGPVGTAYGSEGWGLESLRTRRLFLEVVPEGCAALLRTASAVGRRRSAVGLGERVPDGDQLVDDRLDGRFDGGDIVHLMGSNGELDHPSGRFTEACVQQQEPVVGRGDLALDAPG